MKCPNTQLALSADLVQKLQVCPPGSGVIRPVAILVLHLEPYDGPTVRALQGHQDLEQPCEVPRHCLGVRDIVGAKYHVRIM